MMCPLEGVFMKPPSRSARTAVKLTDSTNRHLNMYALTATAAGVGLMALAQPAQAKIVYTPAHVNFSQHPGVTLDLNHDGIGDFILALGSRVESEGFASQYAVAYAPRSNNTDEIVATSARSGAQAVALRAGERIGPRRVFGRVDILVAHGTHFGKDSSSAFWLKGEWGNGGKGLKDRYLGLKFMISGNVHFGWARVTVTTNGKAFTATLTGYAYETMPNKSIIAGKTKGPDDGTIGEQASPASFAAPTATSATLGLLALGSPGLSVWRRKEAVGVTQ
jgi:hypothetical protein